MRRGEEQLTAKTGARELIFQGRGSSAVSSGEVHEEITPGEKIRGYNTSLETNRLGEKESDG